jgi:hypothetical protein
MAIHAIDWAMGSMGRTTAGRHFPDAHAAVHAAPSRAAYAVGSAPLTAASRIGAALIVERCA